MQRLSGDVLQELQRQTQGQDEAEGPGLGGATAGGRGVGAEPPPETREETFPFPKQSRPYTSPPPPTPASFILESPVEGASVPRRQTLRVPGGGGSRDEFDFFGTSSSPLQRPGSRSRTPTPPPRISPAETLSPQLLGGRVGSDADPLMRRHSPDSVKNYQSDQIASNVNALRTLLSSNPGAGTPSILLPIRASSWKESLRESIRESIKETQSKASHSNRSSLSAAAVSTSSETSQASSFAYGLRARRPDLRLLKKKNQPSQHLIQRASILKQPARSRTPSFYKPKVVEDSGLLDSTTAPIFPTSQSTKPIILKLPELQRSTTAPMSAMRKVPTLALPSIVKTLTPSGDQPDADYPDFFGSSPSPVGSIRRPGFPMRQLRFESPKSTESSVDHGVRPVSTPFKTPSEHNQSPYSFQHHHQHHHRHHDYLHKQHYHAMTPPEREPSISGLGSFHHGDSYFSTFPPDTMSTKEFVPIRTPVTMEQPAKEADHWPLSTPASPLLHIPGGQPMPTGHVKSPSESIAASSKARRPSGLFKLFRKSTLNSFDHGGLASEIIASPTSPASPASNATSSSQTPATPALFTVSTPDGAVNRRRFSSMSPDTTLPPYFARPRSRQTQSDGSQTPSPGHSPLATIDDEPPTPTPEDNRKRRAHNRSSSEQLSPMSTPRRPRIRTRHRPTLENFHDETDRRSTPSPGMRVTSALDKDGGVRHAISLDFPRHRHQSPSTISPSSIRSVSPAHGVAISLNYEVEPEPPRKTSSGFKNFMLGVRRASIAIVDKFARDEDAIESHIDAQRPSLPRNSLSSKKSRPPLRLHASKSSASMLRIQRTRSSRMSKVREESEDRPTAEELQAARRERLASIDLQVTNFQQTPFAQRYHDSRRAHQQVIRSLIEEGMDEDMDEDEDIQLGHERNVPDHLPNSPLCPLHHKHKSGGKAVCPLHGRYKGDGTGRHVKVGPARSRRMVDYHQPGPLIQTPRPPMPERQKSNASSKPHQMEIVFDTRDDGTGNMARTLSMGQMNEARTMSMGQINPTRTQSMGSIDGAWHSPANSRENFDSREPKDHAEAVVEEIVGDGPKWNMEVFQTLDSRGRKRYKDACGSDRRRRRVRMRRR